MDRATGLRGTECPIVQCCARDTSCAGRISFNYARINRKALASDAAQHTVMTAAISGRPARCLANRFTTIDDRNHAAYPRAYDIGKALNAAAKAKGETGYGAQWAGQAAPLAHSMPVAQLVATLVKEMG